MAGNDSAHSIQACAMRISRLAANGTTPPGSTNMLVSDALIKADSKVVKEAGDEFTLKNGCGAIKLTFKDVDKFKRYDLTLTLAVPDPELDEMFTGGTLITSGGRTIGYAIPPVGLQTSFGVCLEVWSKAWIGGGTPPPQTYGDFVTTSSSTTITSPTVGFTSADVGESVTGTGIPGGATIASVTSATQAVLSAAATATSSPTVSLTLGRPGAYWRHVWPFVQGAPGDFSLENGPLQVVLDGPAQENPGIGNGPANDFPATAPTGRAYFRFRDSALPTIQAGYISTPAQT